MDLNFRLKEVPHPWVMRRAIAECLKISEDAPLAELRSVTVYQYGQYRAALTEDLTW